MKPFSTTMFNIPEEGEIKMKVASTKTDPTVYDEYGELRRDCTSLEGILDNIDSDEGRNDAIRAYIFALRDLAVAYAATSYADGGTAEEKEAECQRAQAAVIEAFEELMEAEFAINQPDRLGQRRTRHDH